MMGNSRLTAYKVLLKIEQDRAYSNLAVNKAAKESNLSGVDAAFMSSLVYGVCEREITLDYIISQYSKIPLKKIETKVKVLLRMGIYQLLFMDKVPESAAVNESVKLAKNRRLVKSSGFINGILRSITRSEVKYTLPDKAKDELKFYSVKYSCPEPIIRLWLNSYGENNTEALLCSLFGRPKICARVNTLKTYTRSLISALEAENVTAEECEILDGAVYLKNTGSIERLDSYKKGLFHIQELSSQLCVRFLAPQAGQTVLDVCSAPGGKAFTCAELMNGEGKVFACDLYEHRLRLVENGAKRLGISCITNSQRDASKPETELATADRILCDVPCSGLGMLSRKPEIRYKDNILDNNLPELQYKILSESAKNLKKGGRLVYSTCTLNPSENNEISKRFLDEHTDFHGVPLDLPKGVSRAFDENEYEITLMPHTAKTDGFYIALFERVGG